MHLCSVQYICVQEVYLLERLFTVTAASGYPNFLRPVNEFIQIVIYRIEMTGSLLSFLVITFLLLQDIEHLIS